MVFAALVLAFVLDGSITQAAGPEPSGGPPATAGSALPSPLAGRERPRVLTRYRVYYSASARPLFRLVRERLEAGPQGTMTPHGMDEVTLGVFDAVNNALRVDATPNPGGTHTPANADQVFTSIFNQASDSIRVNCVAGCGGGGSPGGVNAAVQFNSSGAFGGDATNFSYDPVGRNLTVGNRVTAASFVTTGPGAAYTQWTAGAFSGAAGTVTCGGNASNQFACSDNNGALTQMAMISGDLGGSQGAEQVAGVHLTNEGQLGNQPITTTVPNDTSTGTTQGLLAKISSAGAAVKAATTDTGVPVYMVTSPSGAGGNARLVIGGQGLCTFDATLSSSNLGHYVQASPTTAGDCHDAGAAFPSSGWTLGQITAASGTAGTVQVLQGELPGSGSSGLTFQVNGTNTAGQSTINFQSGANIAIANPSAGNISVALTGTLAPAQLPAPTASTLGGVESISCAAGSHINAIASGTGAPTCAPDSGAGTVTTTGSPASGQLATMSGAASITSSGNATLDANGNLVAASSSTRGNPIFSATAYGCLGDNGATDNASACMPALLGAIGTSGGRIYFGPSASNVYAFKSAVTLSNSNVTIECATGVVLQRFSATDGWDVSGNFDVIKNCTLDGNGQSGSGTGPIVNLSGNDNLVDGVTLQNAGVTNPVKAAIAITAGARNKVRNVTGNSMADQCVEILPSSSQTVKDSLIAFNNFTLTAGSSNLNGIYLSDSNSSSVVSGTQILFNTVYASGSNATCYNQSMQLGNSQGEGSNSQHQIWMGNKCTATAAVAGGFHLFGFYHSVVAGNIADDQGHASASTLINLGDVYDSAVTGNSLKTANGGITLIDFGRDSVTGNTIDGVNSSKYGIRGITQSGIGSDTVFSANVVTINSGQAGTCFALTANSSTFNIYDNSFDGNHCRGDGTAGQIGLALADTLGTLSFTKVGSNQWTNLPTGISIGAGAANTQVGSQQFDNVTTPVSDSGTNSRIETHVAYGTATLAGGSATVTLTGADVFNGATTYLCQAADTTTPANAVTVSAYTSGTAFSLAGTGTDSVRYTCRGW